MIVMKHNASQIRKKKKKRHVKSEAELPTVGEQMEQEASNAAAQIASSEVIPQLFLEATDRFKQLPALYYCPTEGDNDPKNSDPQTGISNTPTRNLHWQSLTWEDYNARVNCVAKALIELSIEPGERILLAASNCLEWALLYFGTHFTGCVPVTGVYPNATTTAHLAHIIETSQPSVALVDDLSQISGIIHSPAASTHLGIRWVIYLHGPLNPDDHPLCKPPSSSEVASSPLPPRGVTFIHWSNFLSAGTASAADGHVIRRLAAAAAPHLAAVVFTPGATGSPKAVAHSHRSLALTAARIANSFHLSPADVLVAYLPLAHVTQLVLALLATLFAGAAVYVVPPAAALVDPIAVVRVAMPTVFYGPPRLWEKLYVALRGWSTPTLTTSTHADRERQKQLLRSLGLGRARWLLTGAVGAPPPPAEVLRFFSEALGMGVATTYGSTECGGFVLIGRRDAPAGTVGPARVWERISYYGKLSFKLHAKLKKVGTDGIGEIYLKTPVAMLGYFGGPHGIAPAPPTAPTAAAVAVGGVSRKPARQWVATGDIGRVDSVDGSLTVIGRKGENHTALAVEAHVRAQLLTKYGIIADTVVVSRDSPLPPLLVVNVDTREVLGRDRRIEIARYATDALTALPHSEKEFRENIRVHVTKRRWAIAGGALCPTLAVCRRFVELRYRRMTLADADSATVPPPATNAGNGDVDKGDTHTAVLVVVVANANTTTDSETDSNNAAVSVNGALPSAAADSANGTAVNANANGSMSSNADNEQQETPEKVDTATSKTEPAAVAVSAVATVTDDGRKPITNDNPNTIASSTNTATEPSPMSTPTPSENAIAVEVAAMSASPNTNTAAPPQPSASANCGAPASQSGGGKPAPLRPSRSVAALRPLLPMQSTAALLVAEEVVVVSTATNASESPSQTASASKASTVDAAAAAKEPAAAKPEESQTAAARNSAKLRSGHGGDGGKVGEVIKQFNMRRTVSLSSMKSAVITPKAAKEGSTADSASTSTSPRRNPLLDMQPPEYYTYEKLLARPAKCDLSKLEWYLSPNDFEAVFGMSKEKFYSLPTWKQINKKKEKKLY